MTFLILLGIIVLGSLALLVGWKIIKFTLKVLFVLFCLLLLAAAIYYFLNLWDPCPICGILL